MEAEYSYNQEESEAEKALNNIRSSLLSYGDSSAGGASTPFNYDDNDDDDIIVMDEDEDEDHNIGGVKRRLRLSGAFELSPPGNAQMKTASLDNNSAKKAMYGSGQTTPRMSTTSQPLPMDTPATNMKTTTTANSSTASSRMNRSTDKSPIYIPKANQTLRQKQSNTNSPLRSSSNTAETSSSLLSNNKYNLIGLDRNYRPYHDALLTLLQSNQGNTSTATLSMMGGDSNEDDYGTQDKIINDTISMLQSVNEDVNQIQNSHVSFLKRVSNSSYHRSTLLQQEGEFDESNGGERNDNGKNRRDVKLLEMEGHFWSLIEQLLSPSNSSSFKTSDFLLWKSQTHNQKEQASKQVQNWIEQFVQENWRVDPAEMTALVADSFDGENDGDGIPELVKRRQIILEWIESCHQRSIMGFEVPNNEDDREFMWKDTLKVFGQRNARSSFGGSVTTGRDPNRITTFHPDAPFELLHKTPNTTNCLNPLYGNDNTKEIYLLSMTICLLKAGRFSEVLDLCRAFGQPWRAASWDGNAAHGYQPIPPEDRDGDDINMDEEKEELLERIGNPNRVLWKRTMWKVGRALHSKLDSTSSSSFSSSSRQQESIIASGSLVHEAAISSILADDTSTASNNPLLNTNWMDMIWLYYRGIQSRFMEEVYHSHNSARRKNDVNAKRFPLEGTGYEEEEKEQLACTADMSRLDEGVLLSKLETKFANDASFGQGNSIDFWREGMGSFLGSVEEVGKFIVRQVDIITPDWGEVKLEEEDEAALRFLTHLTLFLDSLLVDKTDNSSSGVFKNEIIEEVKRKILPIYVQHLTTQKTLWHLTALYASLLERNVMMEVCTTFWATQVEDDIDRRMIVSQAREYFADGLDLVILRRVVRNCICPPMNEEAEMEAESSKPFPSMSLELSDDRHAEMESRILRQDVHRMNSVHWLCNHREHYVDALICSNMLLRKLLLQIGTVGGEDEEVDWATDIKLYTAKIFLSRFLPPDLFSEVHADYEDALTDASSDESDEESEIIHVSKTVTENTMAEHEAIESFLDAHTAYEKWNGTKKHLSPNVHLQDIDSRFEPETLEYGYALKMERKKYIDEKKRISKRMIDVAESARAQLMGVLTFDGGWLESSTEETEDISTAIVMGIEGDENIQRLEEMKTLRSKCLPTVVLLTFRVLDNTAQWMQDFEDDIRNNFEDEEAEQILLQISSRDKLMEEETDENSIPPSPFVPETWYRMALLLATTVASKEHGLSDCFNPKDLKDFFMNLMTGVAISHLRSEEDRISQNQLSL